MNDYVALLISVMIVPVTLFIVSLIFKKHPPKEINSIYGYRTNGSRKSERAWDFAQKYSANLLFKLSTILIVVSVLICAAVRIFSISATALLMLIVMVIDLAGIFVVIGMVEKKLKDID